ncbi:MAG TPA: type IV pilus secretin PilQ [Anaeromyxobacteraceae bacterium]|nr:type IV pilus secretin PilQ [Anaeromyxobacteraceae bacterium]
MKTPKHILAGMALAGLLAVPARSAEPPRPAPNQIRAIDVSDGEAALELAIRGSRPPSYTVFKLQDPPRLVVDLAGADVSGVASPLAVNRRGVREVTTAQYKDDRSAVGRVIIALDAAARYEVVPRGESVVVKVLAPDGTSSPSPSPTSAGSSTTPRVVLASETVIQTRKEAPATSAAPADDHVVSRRVDEAQVMRPATAVRSVRSEGGRVVLSLDGQVARFEVIELASPPRLALDLYGVSRAPRGSVRLGGPFTQARFGKGDGRVRVVLDAAGDLHRVDVKRVAAGIAVSVAGERQARASPPASARPQGSLRSGRPGGETRAPRDPAAARLVVVAPAAPSAPEPAPSPVEVKQAESGAAGFAAEAPSYALSGAPQRREYTGRRITLEFHDIEIRNLLRLIADVSKKNIVVADDVTGRVTVSLRNVPWDQALDLVLKTKGLDKEEVGNVIRVAKFEDIAKEQEARAKAAAARAPLIPLKVRLIPVNFARAQDLATRVKEVLSERGSVTTDERTNVLIVKDVQEALARAEGLVRNLDTEIPQVRIESRIVEATSNFAKQIGVQWGGNATFSPGTGNALPVAFPNIAGATGASAGNITPVAGSPNYAVNLPAAVGQGTGGAFGFVFGSAGGAFNLNLRISALENSGVVKTISAPSVSTVDNKEATIGQGLSIPFSQTSAAGVNTVFVEAKLELKVTPHVSADGSILMKIKVTNNQPNPQLTGANGQPSISKREAETEALVKDGETTVIGGIYTRQTSNRVSEIPLLGKIPILGFFFRNKNETDDHTELLIFITPRILNRPATAVAAGQ